MKSWYPHGHKLTKYDAQAMGRANRRRERPTRDILLVREALEALHLRWVGEVSFWNPLHVGKSGKQHGGLQWIDLVVRYKGLTVTILVDAPAKRWKPYEKVAWSNKQAYLRSIAATVIILPVRRTSQEYRIILWRALNKARQEQLTKELGY